MVSRFNFNRNKIAKCLGASLTVLLAGCSPLRPWDMAKQMQDKLTKPVYNIPVQASAPEFDLPIESMPSDAFWVRPAQMAGNLPDLHVQGLSVTEQGIFDVLQIIFSETNYPLSFEGGPDSATRYGVVTVNNLSGTLTEVMNKLGEVMGFFWTVTPSGVVRIMPEQQFVVSMPPILAEDSMAGLTNTVQFMGARDVYLDRINRSLVFRANRKALTAIEGYLDKARQSRSLIVYDMNVLQVDLNDSHNMGIRWELLRGGNIVSSDTETPARNNPGEFIQGGAASRTGTGLDTLILGRNFDANLLIDFLRTQGDVKTLSQPKLGLMNGTNGSIRVGQSTTFVSQVGSQIVNGVAQSQATTQQLRTGLQVSLTGEVHDSTIYSRINISITELLALKKFTALGVDLNLPEVADRELKTQVRCRPGDTILLGGITVTRSQKDYQSGLGIQSKTDTSKLTELVVTIRPKLLNFTQASSKESPLETAPPANVSPIPRLTQGEALVLEKSMTLTRPGQQQTQIATYGRTDYRHGEGELWANRMSTRLSNSPSKEEIAALGKR